tara:strand:- start:25 stop:327 length:303 start_codon:yes stop_codon:yes gene_type:complete
MSTNQRLHAEQDEPDTHPDAVAIPSQGAGVAWRVIGWHTEPDEDTAWSGMEYRTGQLVVVMVGDDHRILVDPDDVVTIDRAAYCGECGQMGCGHDGLDRD